MVPETLQLVNQRVTLPTVGKFVLESHLVSKSDDFSGFPSTETQKIEEHLSRSCLILAAQDQDAGEFCKNVYRTSYHRQWTPSEGGKAGQGFLGNLKPTVVEETFSGNMYWKVAPPPGTKYLACFDGRCVVVVVGYEKGPRDPAYLGGLQGEVLWLLRATSESKIKWGKLKNQSLSPGRIECN